MTYYGLSGPIKDLIPNQVAPFNVTDQGFLSSPATTHDGITVTSGASVWEFGSWVEIFPAATTTIPYSLVGYTFYYGGSVQTFDGAKVQFGLYAAGAYWPIVSSSIQGVSYGSNYDEVHTTVPLSFSGKFDPGYALGVRIADARSNPYSYSVKVVYTKNLIQGGIYLNGMSNVSNQNFGVTCLSGASWAYGNYVTIVPKNSITRDYYIRGMSTQARGNGEADIMLGVGDAGYETALANIATMNLALTADQGNIIPFPFSTAIKVPANTRLAAKVAGNYSVAQNFRIGVDIVEGTFYG